MIGIDKAIKTRWVARNLDASVTGSVHQSKIPQGVSMPYATIEETGDDLIAKTRSSKYQRKGYQFTVYAATELICDACGRAIQNAFDHADRAASNAMTLLPTTDGAIYDVECDEPVVTQAGDEVWMAVVTLVVDYSKPRNITPGS